MKKLFVIATILMMVPFTAFSMDAMNDISMDDVTGQAGVSIGFDGVLTSTVGVEKFSYTDAGSVTLSDADGGNLLDVTTTVTGVITIDVNQASTTGLTGDVIRLGLAGATIALAPIELASNIDVSLGNASLGTIGLGTVAITQTLPNAIEIGTH